MYDYVSRWYDPQLGRFIKPDPIVPNAADSQAFNRYSYVFNRPINLNDPSGYDPYWCDDASNPQQCRDHYFGAHGYGIFQNSLLIVACGMRTEGACGAGRPIYLDSDGVQHVPMYYTATEFANNGGSYVFMDHSTSGNTDQYAQDIVSVINAHPNQSIYLVGHSAGANAIVGALSILGGEDGQGDLSQIQAVALLDPFLWTGDGNIVGHPANWGNLTDLGNQNNADALISAGVPMWVGYSGEDQQDSTNFPTSLAPNTNAVPYLNDTHTGLAVDLNALQAINQFFANPSP